MPPEEDTSAVPKSWFEFLEAISNKYVAIFVVGGVIILMAGWTASSVFSGFLSEADTRDKQIVALSEGVDKLSTQIHVTNERLVSLQEKLDDQLMLRDVENAVLWIVENNESWPPRYLPDMRSGWQRMTVEEFRDRLRQRRNGQ